MGQRLGGEAQHGPQVHGLGDGGAAPVAPVGERPVQGGDETDRAGGPGRSTRAGDLIPRADPVDLEEGLGARRHDVLDRHAGEGAEPMAVPRAAAAAAMATSPPGCTAWTPVGEMRTGNEISWPMTLVARSRLSARPATCGAKPSSRVRGDVVLDREAPLGAGDQRAVDRLGQALLGAPLGLGHRFEPLVCHSEPLVTPCRPAPAAGHRRPGGTLRAVLRPPHPGRPGDAPT